MPTVENVEQKIKEHREKMKGIEDLYMKKKMFLYKEITPMEGIY